MSLERRFSYRIVVDCFLSCKISVKNKWGVLLSLWVDLCIVPLGTETKFKIGGFKKYE
jgi:hypothetical protein